MPDRKKSNKMADNIPGKIEKWQFEPAPPPIPEKDIREVAHTDVVVAGGGISGLCAALSAEEAGARVVLLEKGDTCHARGHGNAALGSKLQKEQGIQFDRDEVITEIMRWGGYRQDQKLVSLWADNSGKVMDWLLDMASAAGIAVIPAKRTDAEHPFHGYIKTFGLTHEFYPDGELTVLSLLEMKMRQVGINVQYETPAVRLIRKGRGRVTGVIAQNRHGYKQFNARQSCSAPEVMNTTGTCWGNTHHTLCAL